MKIVVLKFGGTSVGTIKKIKKVAKIIILCSNVKVNCCEGLGDGEDSFFSVDSS